MSTTAFLRRLDLVPFGDFQLAEENSAVHREPGVRYGHALLMLGQAAEYLEHSRGSFSESPAAESEDEAIHLLKRLSREVFEDYAEDASKGLLMAKGATTLVN